MLKGAYEIQTTWLYRPARLRALSRHHDFRNWRGNVEVYGDLTEHAKELDRMTKKAWEKYGGPLDD